VLANYKIEVSFADGTTGVADLAPRLSQGPLGDGFESGTSTLAAKRDKVA
jgi:hypothetical protein